MEDALGASRHQSIANLALQFPVAVAGQSVDVWPLLATQIISIVGVGGFDALFARSVFLTQSRFTWLTAECDIPSDELRFAKLTKCLENATPELARAANCDLLITFTDTFASLVGEPLTARVLASAWGAEAEGMVGKDMEP